MKRSVKTLPLRIALVQMNAVVGDVEGNIERIVARLGEVRGRGADIAVFPELCLTGYPPEDLLFRRSFLKAADRGIRRLARETAGIAAIVGFPEDGAEGVFNAAAVLADRRIVSTYRKIHLPNYGVFDERRYFVPGKETPVYSVRGVPFGVLVCEDIWVPNGPGMAMSRRGARLLLALNSSPYHAGKVREREKMLAARAKAYKAWIVYVNLVGGQDELVFDGQSLVVSPEGRTVARGHAFREEVLTVDLPIPERKVPGAVFVPSRPAAAPRPRMPAPPKAPHLPIEDEVFDALVCGTRDYVEKNRFPGVVIGLSGGVDSSLVAAVAAKALGPERVTGVLMPSIYTSNASAEDATALARALGIETLTVPIWAAVEVYMWALKEAFSGRAADVTEENIQARVRGNILMALSNKFGSLVLTTGNKSEMAVGYATLYGDMAGGFAVIKDVPKTLVYRICRRINETAGHEVIPVRVLTKAPTAELKPNQTDQDTLPPYEILDPILAQYVENDRSVAEIVRKGFDEEIVRKVARMVDRSEYKRRQAPPGIKITPRAFGRDRRMPITNRFGG
ncbi:MAG: NAD+ synthase [Nitrospirae bacterium]|nr:NAD+ synthase [Nitrospirota bacterium]